MEIPFWLYCTVSTAIATGICCGANMGLTYLLYLGKEAETQMFAWPSTVAGDVVVTIVLTCAITWVLSSQITVMDCSKEKPLHILNKPKSLPRLQPLAVRAQQRIWSSSDNSCSAVLRNSLQVAITGAVLGVLLTLPIGTIFVVAGYYATNDKWTMRTLLIYKGVLGGFLGLILQPFIVILAATKLNKEDEFMMSGEENLKEEEDTAPAEAKEPQAEP